MIAEQKAPIVVMGVAAAGKTSVGSALAHRLDRRFVDGDDLHPPANIAKMREGLPLDDSDRAPWLDAVGEALRDSEEPVVITCSALKRRYRDRIRVAAPTTVFVHLTGSYALLSSRIAARIGHFVPASILDSQLEALEQLGPDEAGFKVDISGDIDSVVDELLSGLRRRT